MTRLCLQDLEDVPNLVSTTYHRPANQNGSTSILLSDNKDIEDKGKVSEMSHGNHVDLSYSSDEDDSNDTNSSDDDADGSSSAEYEANVRPALPFSLGKTRFALDESESMEQYKRRVWVGYSPGVNDDATTPVWKKPILSFTKTTTPPNQSITASTAVLVQYAKKQLKPAKEQQQRSDDDYDDEESDYDIDADLSYLAVSVAQASTVDDSSLQSVVRFQKSDQKAAARMDQILDRQIADEMISLKRKYDLEHQQTATAFTKLLRANQETAKAKLRQQQQHDEQVEQERLEQEEKERRAEEKELQKQQQIEQKKQHAEAEAAARRKKAQDEIDKENEYLVKAKKLVAQLKKVHASIVPFEASKAVGKRRLHFKKTANGIVNTLAENVDKIRQVAADVAKVIADARTEDEQNKAKIASADPNVTPEMTLGKRYMIDLLCTKVMVRAQAEGFNGQRGDGFPLAAMLAMVSTENKEVAPVLAAHIYTVCPTAIPSLPQTGPDASEEEFMAALGMLQLDKKKGEESGEVQFESFERFLSRTEGVISLVADIMASQPASHVLLDGHNGAIQWLKRFLSNLPEAPQSPLPLVTAPVLDAFLSGAGHMLANHHADEFKPILDLISNDIVDRLDVSVIGMPSSIRLKKTIGKGFDGFKSTLPSRALAELYFGADGGGRRGVPSTGLAPTMSLSSPFANVKDSTSATVGFAPSSSSARNTNFSDSSSSNPFGTSASKTPFGSSSTTQTTANASAFGIASSSSTIFGSTATTSSPFGAPVVKPFGELGGTGATAAPNPSPFSVTSTSTFSGGFGGGTSTSNTSPFGGGASGSNSASFGDGMAVSNPSMFGGGGTAPPSVPFGSGGSTSASFGAGSLAANPAPFTAQAPASNPSAFVSNTPFSKSPFGASAPSPSPFSSAVTQTQTQFGASAAPTAFGASPSPFGQAQTNQSPFGFSNTSASNTFGSGTVSSQTPFDGPFGSTAAAPSPSPFGSTVAPSPSPFGNTSNASPFGSFSGQQSSPFGGQQNKRNKPPCRFFAQGRCNKGANCQFSHETPQTNNFSNSFGGPRM